MTTRLAYMGVILIWSTTPLAIYWSSVDVGMLFSVSARMLLGLMVVIVLLGILNKKLRLDSPALKTYVVCGFGIYGGMICVYFAAQHIPTGWISVVFGLAPLITGVLARIILGEDALAPNKVTGMLLGITGLAVIFGKGVQTSEHLLSGLVAVLAGTIIHSLGAVMIKKIGARLDGIASTAGGLIIAIPMFIATWYVFDGNLPAAMTSRTLYAILYLGVMGSAIGFVLYYYILTHMDVSRVALITLITPVSALLLGNFLNHEPLTPAIMTGTIFIMAGLLVYEFGRNRLPGISRQISATDD